MDVLLNIRGMRLMVLARLVFAGVPIRIWLESMAKEPLVYATKFSIKLDND